VGFKPALFFFFPAWGRCNKFESFLKHYGGGGWGMAPRN
jgi:hypothetical protein